MFSTDDSQKLQRLRAENHALRQQLQARQADIDHLAHWYRQLRHDIDDVYASVTWRMGAYLTDWILWLLRHPQGPTAQDHIKRLHISFDTWQQAYLAQHAVLPYTPWHEVSEYQRWLATYESFPTTAQVQDALSDWPDPPCFALILVDEEDHAASVNSVLQQIYPHWRGFTLCQTPKAEISQSLLTPIPWAGSYADSVNQALHSVTADYVICLRGGDQLAPHALFEFARALTQADAPILLYSDHDTRDQNGQRQDPFFKPDWSPDLVVEQNYVGSALAFHYQSLRNIGGLRPDYPGLELYEAVLRLYEQQPNATFYHLPKVLFHQQARDTPPLAPCVQAHFQRSQPSVVVHERDGAHAQVVYPLPTQLPLLSVIIPTRDKLNLLRGTLDGVLHTNDYPALEILLVDNGSREADTLAYLNSLADDVRITILRVDAPFNFSRLNNLAATQAKGGILALLNNDLRMTRPDWLSNMVRHAVRQDIGTVGAKLYYPDDTLQHAGVVTGLGGLAGHPFKHLPKALPAYHWRPFVTYNCAAVTAACLVLRKSVFDAVGGFDEQLKVAFNDVDLCLRIGQQGYRHVWTPDAELYHLESVSRGVDDTPRKFFQLQRELAYMRKRWGDLHDPYYNPNLTLQYEDYALAWPPRV